MSEKLLDVPVLSFFEQGNIFTGCCRADFRYRIAKDADTLAANIWHQDVCYGLCDTEDYTFPLTDEGLSACIAEIAARAEAV